MLVGSCGVLPAPPSPWPSPSGRERELLGVEGLAALVAIPEANEMALALGLVGVAEGCPAVGEEPVVQVLELPAFDGELDPVRGRIHDGAHRDEGIVALLVDALALEVLGILDEGVIVSAAETPRRSLEDRLPSDPRVVRRVLGLPVPGHRLVPSLQQLGMR